MLIQTLSRVIAGSALLWATSSCSAGSSQSEIEARDVVVAPWYGKGQVTTDPTSASPPDRVLITPSRSPDGSFFVPADLQSAWAELSKLLPIEMSDAAKLFRASPGALCKELDIPADWSLREWLVDNWLGKTGSPLMRYFRWLGLDLQTPADKKDAIGFILCGHFRTIAGGHFEQFAAYEALVSSVRQRQEPPPPQHTKCAEKFIVAPPEIPILTLKAPHRTSNRAFSVDTLWVAKCPSDGSYLFYDFWDGWFYDTKITAELEAYLKVN